ncbi:hypothetical protein [Aureivirga sp. CE67]|uniref:hypothetical protein n=1 Tax=Aureivirga sp. CE67 TaxID=1788983 RepID=UPI0018CA5F74|nr:hypothetical protein [Aureivirga sp. CE67]
MKKTLLFIFISFTFFCCNSDDENNENIEIVEDYSEYTTENSLDHEIDFMPIEVYNNSNSPQNPSLKLQLNTVELLPCANYEIITTQFTKANELIIRLEDVPDPIPCALNYGHAYAYIDLPENISEVTLINGNTIDKYIIEINNEKVNISLIENNFTNLLYEKTFRYPENSFAYICGTSNDNTNIYEDFSAIIEQNPNITEFEFVGEGRIPYQESQGNKVNHPSKFYKYSSIEDFNSLANILNNYASENIEENAGVSISIINWESTSYRSWLEN